MGVARRPVRANDAHFHRRRTHLSGQSSPGPGCDTFAFDLSLGGKRGTARLFTVSCKLSRSAAWLLATFAGASAMPIVGYLSASAAPNVVDKPIGAFVQGLRETGYTDGRNVKIEYRTAKGRYDRVPALIADLVQRRAAVIAAMGHTRAIAAKRATTTIPIVFYSSADPVASGLVTSLGRPGGNLTGVGFLNVQRIAKRIDILRELLPRAGAIGILLNPTAATASLRIREAESAARANRVRIVVLSASDESELEAAFTALSKQQVAALVVGIDAFFNSRNDLLICMAARYAVPVLFPLQEFVEAGGLMS